MNPKIGLLTIGQSPREDLIKDLSPILGEEVDILECGALDHLSREEIKELKPEPKEPFQVTLLKNKEQVLIKKQPLLPLLKDGVTLLNDQGAQAIIIWCTGEFPDFPSRVPVIKPDNIMRSVVSAVLPSGTLGILCPSPDQCPQIKEKWESMGYECYVQGYSPFQPAEELADVVGKITKQNIDMMVLDCMGMKTDLKNEVKKLTDKPVVLPLSLIARVVLELI